jgi:Adenomatosis polyposis coli down-regulated 1
MAASRIIGSWASSRCETRSYGVFLTRHFEFMFGPSDDGIDDSVVERKRKWIWSARQGYFGDVLCRRAMYSVETSGTYRVEESAGVIVTDGDTASATERSFVDTFNIEFNVCMTSALPLYLFRRWLVAHE